MLRVLKSNMLFLIFSLIFSQNVSLPLENDFIWVALRSLSIPIHPGDIYSHKCYKEVPTLLTLEAPDDPVAGNGTNRYWTKYEICCDGYKRYEYDWNICVPDCGKECANGLCVSPAECHCFPGFIKNDDGDCVSTCPLGCLNGKCSFDGYCTCNKGYELDETRKYCRPVCRTLCLQNFNCTAPDRCECLKGYELVSGICHPVCKPNCQRGSCQAPNKCICNKDSVLKNGICQANCSLVCKNGFCSTLKTCICDYGYRYEPHTTSCIPKCDNCFNGTCIAPNICKCYKGYKLVHGQCEPSCPKGCHGGICKEPNKCVCEYGIVDSVGYCRAFSERRCISAAGQICTRWSDLYHWND